jgi:hypothetical protein
VRSHAERGNEDGGGLSERIDSLLARGEIWVDRHHPRPRQVNIRPYLRNISVAADAVRLDLWVTGQGTAKADELARLLGVGDGVVLERTELELHDEAPPGDDGPPVGPPETRPLATAVAPTEPAPAATWGLSPNGPLIE